MPDTTKPWEPSQRHAAFTAERLSEIATALRDIRDDALNTFVPLKGETVWSLGCAKHERSIFAIVALAQANPTWLTLVPEAAALRCTFAMEGVPVRFFHQGADVPPPKYKASTENELKQYQMLFEVEGVPFRQLLYRLAIKDDVIGKVESITLVEFDTGALVNEYTIPFDLAPSKILPLEGKPVNLEKIDLPALKPEREDKQANNDKEDNLGTGTK